MKITVIRIGLRFNIIGTDNDEFFTLGILSEAQLRELIEKAKKALQ